MKTEPFIKADALRTALHSAAMNEIVRSANKWLNLQVLPAGVGRLSVTDANARMEFHLQRLLASREIRVCIGGTGQQVKFGGVLGGGDPNYAHLPFLSTGTARAGSFFGGGDEDEWMSVIWRMRRFKFYTDTPILWTYSGTPYTLLDIPVGSATAISSGEQIGGVVIRFRDEEEILSSWRYTDAAVGLSPISPGVDSGGSIQWGTVGSYGDPLLDLGGNLDSFLYTYGSAFGDYNIELGTEEGYSGIHGTLDVDTGITLDFDPTGIDASSSLYTVDLEAEFPGATFSGGPIILKPDLWWAWTINGSATWNITTGANLESATRNDTSGYPRAFFCQQA